MCTLHVREHKAKIPLNSCGSCISQGKPQLTSWRFGNMSDTGESRGCLQPVGGSMVHLGGGTLILDALPLDVVIEDGRDTA